MNKQLKFLSRTVFGMFLVLFFAVTMIQFVDADSLRANEYNTRTLKNSYKVERGSILVQGTPVAYSVPSKDEYRFTREYDPGRLYAPITGYYTRQQGMTGLESAMNEELSGTAGSQFFARIQRIVSGNDPQGSSVETTIDAAAQKAAAKAMKGYDGAVAAIEPKTGRILALYSTPGFDPNKLASNDDAEVIKNYRKLDADPRRPLVNRAIAGDLYHPGSTFKLITAAAALETGKYTPKSTFKNPASLTLPQSTHQMRNWTLTACGPGSKVTLQQAIVESCNIPMAEMAMELDRDALPKMAKAFGFEQDLSIPLTVTPSQAPLPVDQAQTALTAIGQLDVRATPLQMAMVSAGIANGGTVMKPQLVRRVISPDLQVEKEYDPETFSTPISKKTADALGMMMEHVVSDANGTGTPAAIDGVRVAGKTGTAENGLDENGAERPYTLWFTGFAPVEDPKIAIAVVIADGGGAAHQNVGTSYELPTAVSKQVMEAVLKR